jgi:hypothetical protein
MEIAGTYGLPQDKRRQEAVLKSEDTIAGEIWDMRLGPVIWEKFRESYPEELFEDDKKNLQQYFMVKFAELTPTEFFKMAKEIMSGSDRGKKMVANMVKEIKDELQQQDFEDAIGGEDDDDDDMDDFLKSLGIG